MDTESIHGLMADLMKVSGKIINHLEKEFFNGKTEDFI